MSRVEGWCAECGRSSDSGATLVREADTEICLPCKRAVEGTPFAGLTSGKITHDPMPFSSASGTRFAYPFSTRPIDGLLYAPRPEYDNHNPILADIRARGLRGSTVTQAHAITGWINAEALRAGYKSATPEHIDHARRVLAKLAALTTTPNGVTD